MNEAIRRDARRKGKWWWWRIEPGDAIPELMSVYALHCGDCGYPLHDADWSALPAPLWFSGDINEHAGRSLVCGNCGKAQRIPHES